MEVFLARRFCYTRKHNRGHAMTRPNWLRRGGIAVLFSSIFVSVLTATLLSIITSVHSASALSLPSVELGLPLQNTPLAQVTNALNNVTSKLPISVSVQNTPNTVDASVNTGIGGPTPLQAKKKKKLPWTILTPKKLKQILQ